jgi:hypothetical protein
MARLESPDSGQSCTAASANEARAMPAKAPQSTATFASPIASNVGDGVFKHCNVPSVWIARKRDLLIDTRRRPHPRPPVFSFQIWVQGWRGRPTNLSGFERFDVLYAINDATADTKIRRPLLEPAPPFERARADLPAARQVDLVEMPDRTVRWEILS